jgi:hypothetical protein
VSGYTQGRDVEYAVIHHLLENGYDCTRAASSKGSADIIALKHGQALLVNVKRTTPPGPKERADLLRIAALLPGVGVPLVALGPASALTFRRLTGVGPRDWVPWVADEVGAVYLPPYAYGRAVVT